METVNTALIIGGAIVTILGVLAFFNPIFTKVINFPGGPRLKAVGTMIIGVILIIAGLIVDFSKG